MKLRTANSGVRSVILILLIIQEFALGARVGAFQLIQGPLNHSKSPVLVEKGAVALSETITAKKVTNSSLLSSSSIMFVIDDSPSMNYYNDIGPIMDQMGNRFSVTSALIDSLSDTAKYPGIEIGLAAFYGQLSFNSWEYGDSVLLEKIPNPENDEYGEYIPLLSLYDTYKTERFESGTGLGKDILKKYLETYDTVITKDSTFTSKWLKWGYHSGGTNIHAGFRAAVEAMKRSKNPKENQFIIFISDGVSTPRANGPLRTEWKTKGSINGNKIPTTFTIFFSEKGSAPQELISMNAAVKNNGYSSSNSKNTQLWPYVNSGREELTNFIMKNIISIIRAKVSLHPKEISANTVSGTSWNEGSESFTTGKLIPLTGDTTIVDYRFRVDMQKEFSSGTTEAVDTTISFSNTYITVHDSLAQKMNCLMKWWERSIRFFYKGKEITAANDSMDSLEIRFIPERIDTFYNYENVRCDLLAQNGSAVGDHELLSFKKKDSYHTVTVPLRIAMANPNSSSVELTGSDTVTLSFRNPELPLDTVSAKIPFRALKSISVKESAFFDTNADGYPDSLFITMDGGDLRENKADLDLMLSQISLPAERNLTITGKSVVQNGISLRVKSTGDSFTGCSESDTITVKEAYIPSGARMMPTSISVKDRMAPVIISAQAVQYESSEKQDTLRVVYSEPVEILTQKPHSFAGTSKTALSAELSILSKKNSTVLYKLSALNGRDHFISGDSIWIHAGEKCVTDLSSEKNCQQNSANVRRPIETSYTMIPWEITSAEMFDNSADGRPDSIFIAVKGGVSSACSSESDKLKNALRLPKQRDLTIEKIVLTDKGIELRVVEQASRISTAVSDQDSITLEGFTFSDGRPLAGKALPLDRMAPIVVSAKAVQYESSEKQDTLRVVYSEPVEILTQMPHSFSASGGTEFRANLSVLSSKDAAAVYQITVFSPGRDHFVPGDSIWIYTGETAVQDRSPAKNGQRNSANIRRPLESSYEMIPWEMTAAEMFDNSADGRPDSIFITVKGGNPTAYRSESEVLKNALELPETRDLVIDKIGLTEKGISLLVTERADRISTAVSDQEYIELRAFNFSDGRSLSGKILPADRMAPVVISAQAVQYEAENKQDTLRVVYSEPVEEVFSRRPHQFSRDGVPFSAVLRFLSRRSETLLYEIKEIDQFELFAVGDSVWISTESDTVADTSPVNNVQKNSGNIRQKLAVSYTETPVEIELTALSPICFAAEQQTRIPDEILGELSKNGELVSGMLIMTHKTVSGKSPQIVMRGKISIFDALGNCLVKDDEFTFLNSRKELAYVWDGKNLNGRTVGSGAYRVSAEVEIESRISGAVKRFSAVKMVGVSE